jgi:hypothetical protein
MKTLYEYLSGNIQLPQNVKDYIYTKLGTKRYQLIDLGDNVKWRTVKMENALTSSHLNMAASRLITEAKQVYGKFLHLMDDIHRVESKVSKHGLLFYQYLLALKEITHERVQKSYYL